MKRKEYESPQTLIAEIELESCFCASIGERPQDSEGGLTISDQTPGKAIGGSGSGWSDGTEFGNSEGNYDWDI